MALAASTAAGSSKRYAGMLFTALAVTAPAAATTPGCVPASVPVSAAVPPSCSAKVAAAESVAARLSAGHGMSEDAPPPRPVGPTANHIATAATTPVSQ